MKADAIDEGASKAKRVHFALPASAADGRPPSSFNSAARRTSAEAAPNSYRGGATLSESSNQKLPGFGTARSEMRPSVSEMSARMETRSKDSVTETMLTRAAISLSDDWQLTWPIWHMLPRSERKDIAVQHGYKTIGEFEEFMSLQRAVGETSARLKPYENQLAYRNSPTDAVRIDLPTKPSAKARDKVDEEEGQQDTDREEDERLEAEHADASARDASLSPAELVRLGGNILILPEDMLHRVFDWLPVDAYATLALVSPHWRSFTRTEAVYKKLCERLYLNQSKRRALHVNRFGNSYRIMLERRPRVRAGGGVYVLKYSKVQPIQRDMWTEIPLGAVLERVYYRYLYFQENGRVLYALTSASPVEVFGRFLRMCLSPSETDESAVWGTYQVHKRRVTVTARQPWQYVKFEMTIQPNHLHGRYGMLSLDKHVSNTTPDFDEASHCPHRVQYEVPEEPFRFVRDKRL